MKKTVRIVLAILFVLAIMIASTPLNALAKSSDGPTATPNHPLVAGGTWTNGNEVDVTVQAGSAPSWIQLLANGVKVTEAGNICHPFRGGQFGWVGQIMQYKNGQWVKLETTNDWVPNKEGEFMSCAQAPAAGTYALFGYWKRPAGYVEDTGFDCNKIEWSSVLAIAEGNILIDGSVTNVSPETTMYFTISSSDPSGASGSGTGTVDDEGHFMIDTGIYYSDYLTITFNIYEGSHNCQYESEVSYVYD